MATVTLFAAMMDRCRKGHAASDYAIQASFVVISQTFASAFFGGLGRISWLPKPFSCNCHTWIFSRDSHLEHPAWRYAKLCCPDNYCPRIHDGKLCNCREPRTSAIEIGVGFGPLLPSRIGKVREIQNTWGLRAGTQTAKGFFEADWAHGRNDGIVYNTFGFDYRLSLSAPSSETQTGDDELPVHFLLGFHMDHFKGLDEESFRTSGGWHYGGGVRLPLGGIDSPFLFRAEFRHRFSRQLAIGAGRI